METLVAVAHDRNHHQYNNGRNRGNFRGINCRTFESGAGLLPTPAKSFSTPVTKKAVSPKTPSPFVNSKTQKNSKRNVRSRSMPIPVRIQFENEEEKKKIHFSELWAGPAYSNSPPPSSLPLPKFSMRPKRTVSLEIPKSAYDEIDLHTFAKSAPSSPTRDRSPSPSDVFGSPDFATKTLRRMLNLDITDE